MIRQIDIAVRQVLIEARIVEASDKFSRTLGVRLGYNNFAGDGVFGSSSDRYTIGGSLEPGGGGHHAERAVRGPAQSADRCSRRTSTNVNLPASPTPTAAQAGQFSIVLFNSSATKS